MSSKKTLYIAFVVSGVAGLVYEVLWARYLGLYVGHSAYAQVLVLAVYLGGMALGSMIVADVSARLSHPVRWYALAEVVLALFGLAFHAAFVAVSDFSYDTLFPSLGSAQLVGSVRWGVAGLLILPQAMVLGATFPLMAAAVVRTDAAHPGRGVARVYLLNTLGGATGVLLAGFWMIGAFGLPGTSAAAALLNLTAAGLAFAYARRAAPSDELMLATAATSPTGPTPGELAVPTATSPDSAQDPWKSSPPPRLAWVLLTVSFGTALASFAYEIGWI
ncbi:MAG: fused MFS/spermidine synthase, partial [Gemmatimonadota bacterium]|nr:fused MFS/spermidine synthase [Gemmatimonadota bacterium]